MTEDDEIETTKIAAQALASAVCTYTQGDEAHTNFFLANLVIFATRAYGIPMEAFIKELHIGNEHSTVETKSRSPEPEEEPEVVFEKSKLH